ncbi:protease complex subunit PrcB family protein [Bacillus sp. FJAT-45350]|uniref:protease complex subunit PrcB family protein n=1 Tax=Bacillus sp. FJAT-45350 TaxID=2011014 RepID=UPI0015C89B6F|nr:protease complex subunit PrcB family protein [Bacillus sp. FJAT-45350]
MRKFPECVDKIINDIKKKGGCGICSDEGYSYAVLALGKRRTGGYSIVIDHIDYRPDKIIIYATEEKPAPDQFVTQVITYPIKVKKLPLTEVPVVVIWK